MKKALIVLSIVLTLAIGTAVAYADSNSLAMNFPWGHHNNLSEESMKEFMEDRTEFRNNEIEEALKDGRITESEAKEWEEHFIYMDEFHNENGYLHGGRGCGRGSRTENMGHHGMMRGNRY